MLNWVYLSSYQTGFELNFSYSKNNGEIQRYRLRTSIENSLDSFIFTKIYDFDFFYNSFEDLIPINLSLKDGFKGKKRDGISGLKPPIIEYFYNDLSISTNLSFSSEEFKNITALKLYQETNF